MKKLILLFLFISSISFAQNGINYQGAATDSQGNKLENQNISLRTSVLQGGVDGTTSYSETHSTTTDQFGLFNVVIGQGEIVSGDFEGISWGDDAHFLKVELDASGGTDYNLVSTTQMMSVPYALYAKNAGLDSASLAEIINELGNTQNYGSNTSNLTFGEFEDITNEVNENLTNVAPYPQYQQNEDGFLYILLNNTYNNSNWFQVNVDSVPINPSGYYYPGNSSMMSLLIPVKKDYFWTTAAYGVTVAKAYWIKFNNYSNNTSTSNLDSAVVTEMIANSGMSGTSKSFKYPDGMNGTPVTIAIGTNNSYTVPEGKNLYVNYFRPNNYGDLFIDDIRVASGYNNYNSNGGSDLLYVGEGQTITCNNSEDIYYWTTLNGILTEKFVDLITFGIGEESEGNSYTVPEGKNLHVNYFRPANYGDLFIDNIRVASGYNNYNSNGGADLLFVGEGQTITCDNDDDINLTSTLNGYLADLDYFESPNSNSGDGGNSDVQMTVSTFGDTLTIGDQSVIVPGISYENITPEFGSVTDIDGNTYETLSIGDIEIMREDLRTSSFSNGISIPYWSGPLNTPTYYVETNGDVLYSGMAVIDDQGLCPIGWHVAGENDYNLIFSFFSDSIQTLTDCNGTPCLEYYWNSAIEVKSTDWNSINDCPSSYNNPTGINNIYLNLNRTHYVTGDFTTEYFNNPSLKQFNLSCSNNFITLSHPNIDNMSLRVRCVKD